MRYKYLQPTLALVFALVCLAPATLTAEDLPEGLHVRGDTMTRFDTGTEAPMWSIRHASVWSTDAWEEQEFHFEAVTRVDDRLYYGMRSWVMEVDWATGVIVERHLFPATIVGIDESADGLAVVVRFERLGEGDDFERTFSWTPGDASPGEIWDHIGLLATWKDASYLAPGSLSDESNRSPEDMRRDLRRLERRSRQEPKNPFYAYIQGRLLERLGESEQAADAFDRAADTQGAHWTTYLALASFLDDVRAFDAADRAFATARARIEDNPRVNVRISPSLVCMTLSLGWSRDTTAEAVVNRDFENVDRIHERIAWTFPFLERSPTTWSIAADWYSRHDRPELADKWAGHAERAGASPWRRFYSSVREADLALVFLFGFGFAVWPALFVIGARRARDADDGLLVTPRIGELVAVFLVVLVPLPLLLVQQQASAKVGAVASMPLEAMNGGWSSTNVEEWVDEMAESPEKSALQERLDEVANARLAGEPEAVTLEDMELLASATETHAESRALEQLQTTMKPGILQGEGVPSLPTILPGWMILMAVFYLIGTFIGSRFPRAATAVQWLIPGGAKSAGWATPFVLGLALAAVGAVAFGFDSILQRISTPSLLKYVGMDSLSSEDMLVPSRVWAWASIAGVLVFHVATHWLDTRAEESTDDTLEEVA